MTALRGLDALDDAIAFLVANPHLHQAQYWRCKSGMCLAGTMADRAGGEWLYRPGHPSRDYLAAQDGDTNVLDFPKGRLGVHVINRAEAILGFRRQLNDGRDLFSGAHTLEDLKALQADLHAAAKRTHGLRYLVRELEPAE